MRYNRTTYTLRDKIAIGFAGGGLLLLFLLFIFGPLVINYLGWKQMNALFEGEGMQMSGEEPVIKRPYIVYGRDNKGDWQEDYEIYNTELIKGDGHSDMLKNARTCVFLWADTEDQVQSSQYYWTGTLNDARFCPVYMRVIDRENGIRYADIEIGVAPIVDLEKDKFTYSLYNPHDSWTTFDMDEWLAEHLEK